MRRPLALLLALVLAAIGCRTAPPMTDPFRRTRIPPPSTGQYGPAPAAVYGAPPPMGMSTAPVVPLAPPPASYGAPPPLPTGMSNPPVYQSPPPPPPAGSPNLYAPPSGGWAPTSSRDGDETPAIRNNVAMHDEVRPLAESVRPGRLSDVAGGRTLDDGAAPGEHGMEPLANSDVAAVSQSLPNVRRTGGVEPVSYQVPVTVPPRTVGGGAYAPATRAANSSATSTSVNRPTSSAAPRGPADRGATYGYDARYAWLQGQLEYSEATRQWKLRYIPIDGPTDRYGGSVVLASSPILDDHRPGDFVSVKGKLDESRTGQGSFAPLYTISGIDRLSD